jgi:hypothetical protein
MGTHGPRCPEGVSTPPRKFTHNFELLRERVVILKFVEQPSGDLAYCCLQQSVMDVRIVALCFMYLPFPTPRRWHSQDEAGVLRVAYVGMRPCRREFDALLAIRQEDDERGRLPPTKAKGPRHHPTQELVIHGHTRT